MPFRVGKRGCWDRGARICTRQETPCPGERQTPNRPSRCSTIERQTTERRPASPFRQGHARRRLPRDPPLPKPPTPNTSWDKSETTEAERTVSPKEQGSRGDAGSPRSPGLCPRVVKTTCRLAGSGVSRFSLGAPSPPVAPTTRLWLPRREGLSPWPSSALRTQIPGPGAGSPRSRPPSLRPSAARRGPRPAAVGVQGSLLQSP